MYDADRLSTVIYKTLASYDLLSHPIRCIDWIDG